MAGGDLSGCVELSAGYFSYNRFDSGKIGFNFDVTGNASERLIGKDPTVDLTSAALYIDYAQLSCGSVDTGIVALCDGSAGQQMFGILACISQGQNSQEWDFRDDPFICLTADNTQSLCLTAGDGLVMGFIKCHWGNKPSA